MANATLKAPRPGQSQDANNAGSTPVAVFRVGSVSVARFVDGNVSLRRSYRTTAGKWKSTTTLRAGDVPSAIEALTQCRDAASASEAETK